MLGDGNGGSILMASPFFSVYDYVRSDSGSTVTIAAV